MRTLDTTARITAAGTLTLQVPPDLAPGEYHIVVMIDEELPVRPLRPPLQLAAYPVGLTTPAHTFRREDLYDDAR